MRSLIALWLTIAAIGASAQGNGTVSGERMPDQVLMSDGSTVKPIRAITRASDEDYTYTYKGVKYTYISANNWKAYFDQNMHTPTTYGWYENEDGWVYILNDLVGFFTNHTHLACIADNGFTGESKVKRIYFQDADAQTYNANSAFQFFIGHKAFANAPNLEKIDMMQYTTHGTNHWEPMPATAVKLAWGTMLDGSPNAMIRVAVSTLTDYQSSSVWAKHLNRITSYEPSGYEIKAYGASYKCMLAEDNKTYLTNDGNQRSEVMQQLRLMPTT